MTPLMLRRASAARACDMTTAQFERAICEGELPQPILIAGEERWSVAALESAVSKLCNGDVLDWRKNQPGLKAA